MIDFHTHILPEMDDGSRNLEQTRRMLQMEYRQGVRKVVVTPHFYAEQDFPEEFLKRRSDRMTRMRELLSEEEEISGLQIRAGAEVYYFNGMSEASMLPELCVEGTSVLLLEMPFRQWDKSVYREVEKIIDKRKLTVVLAHIERYYGYQKSKDVWNHMFELPVYAQMNAEAFLTWGKRHTAMKLLKKGYAVVLGSDCHDTEKRPPNLGSAREEIRKKAGEEILEQIDRTGKRVFG